MARKTVAVYDSSEGYINRFLEYLSGKTNLWFEAAGFHDIAALENYLTENKVDVLLFSMEELVEETEDKEEQYEKLIAHENVKEVVYFGERRNSKSRFRHIGKYQSMESILSELKEIVFSGEEQRKLQAGERRTQSAELVGIYTPAIDRTTAAAVLKLAEALSAKRQVLLIDLERFSLIPYMTGMGEGHSLSDLIYFYKTSPVRLRFASKSGAGDFTILIFCQLLLTWKIWTRFRKAAGFQNWRVQRYETIVVYMAEAFRNPEYVFDACDTYVPVAAGTAESYKVSRFTKYLIEKGRQIF